MTLLNQNGLLVQSGGSVTLKTVGGVSLPGTGDVSSPVFTGPVGGLDFVASGVLPNSTAGLFATGALSYSDTGLAASFEGSVNSYIQQIIQNTSTGAAASVDYIVNNSLSTATAYYGDFGMNGSGFTGAGSLSLPNAVYLTATSGDMVVGTTTGNAIHFVINGSATDALQIATSGKSLFQASSTAAASINLAQGVAPASPANGDVWTTPSGVYAQIAGATVGPLSSTDPSLFASRAAAAAKTVLIAVQSIIVRGYATEGDCAPHSYVRVAAAPTYPGVTFVGTSANLPYFQDASGAWWELMEADVDPRYLGAISDLANSAQITTTPGQVVNLFGGSQVNISSADTGKYIGVTGVGAPVPATKFLRVTGVPVAGETLVISQALQSGQTGTGTGAVLYASFPNSQTSSFVTGTYILTFSGPLTFTATDPASAALGTGYVSSVFPASAITSITSAANTAPANGYTTTITFAAAHGYPVGVSNIDSIVISGVTNASNGTSANGRWFNVSCPTTTTMTFLSLFSPGTTITVGTGSVQVLPVFTGVNGSAQEIFLQCQQGDVPFASGDTISVAMTGIVGTFGATTTAATIATSAAWNTTATNIKNWIAANTGFTAVTAVTSDTLFNELQLQTAATGSEAGWWTAVYNGAAQTTIPIKHKYFSNGFDYGDAFGTVSYTYVGGGGSGAYTMSGTYSTIQAPGTVAGPDHNSTSSFSAYFASSLMYVTAVASGRVITGTQISTVNGVNTNLFGRVDKQISGTPGGAGVYAINVCTFATTATTAGSSGAPLTCIQNSPTFLTIGTNNYAALQNAFNLSGYIPSAGVSPLTSAPQTSQYALQHLGKRRVVIRTWGDTGIFGTLSPIVVRQRARAEWQGDALIMALPGFNGATSSLGGQGSVLQIGDGTTAFTSALNYDIILQDARVEAGYGWAQRCIWFQSFCNPAIKLQGTTSVVGGRRGILVGYRNAQSVNNNNNTLYTGDIYIANQAYNIGYKVDPEQIGLHVEQSASDNSFGRITGFQNYSVIEDNGSANVYDDAHCDSGAVIQAFTFTGGSIYKFNRLYADSFGCIGGYLNFLGNDLPQSSVLTTGNSSIVFGTEIEAFHLSAVNRTNVFNTTTYAAQTVIIDKLTWAGATPGGIATGPTGSIVVGLTTAQLQQYPTVVINKPTMPEGSNLVGEYAYLLNPFNSLQGILVGQWPGFMATSTTQLVPGSRNISTGSTGTYYLPYLASEGQIVEATFTSAAPTIKTNDGATISINTATVSGTGTVSGATATITPATTAISYANSVVSGSTGVTAPRYAKITWVRTATGAWSQFTAW